MTGMRKIRGFARDLQACRSGGVAIEYAVVAAGVAATVAATVFALGATVSETFYDKLANLF